ncbi:LemA family protein [Nostocaceae cyanobacterium CENA357]|uniref:LemA family protein n=1 Tax=Atlanticothrix silvestris CENA357 TaxID=1725252 RepID=A0A8J7HLF2_9CYAN|nr:LemA family protein [Atlanticothrix silvestris]MBH8554928.1 LemA family protein [Atlanticothrix silvestris CENA357]
MSNQYKTIPEDIVPQVLKLASRYYANHTQSYSASKLVAAGKEVDIPSEFIQQAIWDVQAQYKQQRQQQQRLAHLRQRLLIIAAGVVAALTVWSALIYNSIQSSNSKVEAAWAQVENQLQRRADLIPNLVNVTQAYAKQEKELVSLLMQSRQAFLQATNPDQKVAATVQINQAIDHFRDYASVNPQLQSSQLFTNLQYELTGTENRLAVERMRYNQAVQAYNQKIQSFPNFLISNTIGFEKKEFFQATNTGVPKI